jgi:predicted MPP superfamily phosphohydrolase
MSTPTPVRAAAARLFFANFFILLLVTVSAAQWSVFAWLASIGLGLSLPWWAHGLATGGVYAGNRALTTSRARQRSGVFRLYTATAFVTLFCGAFLGLSALMFLFAQLVIGGVSAQALGEGGQTVVGAGLQDTFRWIASSGMAAIALTMGYGYTLGQRALRVTSIPLAVKGLEQPLRVAQISDIHVGQHLQADQLRAFVARVNATQPDLICITGDIVDSALSDLALFFPILGQLRARFGVYAILGNHDHYAGADRVAAALHRWTPIRVLRDDAVTLQLDGARLHVIGLDDRGRDWARGMQADGVLAELLEAAPAEIPVLLLAHRPDIFHQAAAAQVALTLSGHTHGGQLAVPWFGGRRRNLAEFVTPFDRGLYRSLESSLYVNSGLGVTGQRIRLWTPREISVFELTPA